MKSSNNNKKSGKNAALAYGAFLLIWMIFSGSSRDPGRTIIAVTVLLMGACIAATVFAVKKAAATGQPRPRRTQANPAQPDARPVPRTPFFSRDAREEEAVHCGHSRGREKYIEQLESYLKNGIIDKDEYRIMRARYEKLELPDDYH